MKPETALYFATLAPYGDTGVFLGGHLLVEETEPTGTTLLAIRDNKWVFLKSVPAVIGGITSAPGGNPMLALGRDGEVFTVNPETKEIAQSGIALRGPTYMQGIIRARDQFCAFGGSHQVYLGQPGDWTAADANIYREFVVGELHMLYDMAEAPDGSLVTCGRDGFTARMQTDRWQGLDAPTNLPLHAIAPLGEDRFVLVGAGGAVFVLKNYEEWHDLTETLGLGKPLWDVQPYKDKLYLAASDELIELSPVSDTEFEVTDTREMPATKLCANDYLWCIGGEEVLRFDGEAWETFLCPANS